MICVEIKDLNGKTIIANNINIKYIEQLLNNELKGGFVQKIQMLDVEEPYLKIRFNSKEKKNTLIVGNGQMVITKYDVPSKDENKGFSLNINKLLYNKRLNLVKQKNMEKIIEFEFEYNYLIFELFSTKNIIITDKDYNILDCLYREEWKDRVIKPKSKYILPNSLTKSITDFDKNKFNEVFKGENIVFDIINNINVSPNLVELILKKYNINKTNYTIEDLKRVIESLKNIYGQEILEDKTYLIGSSKIELYNVSLEEFSSDKLEYGYNHILDELVIKNLAKSEELGQIEKKNKDVEKISQIVKRQERKLKEFENNIEETKIKGDLIYQYYSDIENIVNMINDAKNKGKDYEQIENIINQNKDKIDKLKIFQKIDRKKKKVVFTLQLQH